MLETENAARAAASNAVQGFRLAPQQRHLWRLEAGGAGGFQVRCVARLSGALAPEALAAAFAEVVARHEILRTVFHRAPGTKFPVQVIKAHLPPRWRAIDLSLLTEAEQRERVATLSAEADARPFDVERGPLLEATLVTLSPESHLLLLRAHSLVADAAGLQNVLAEVARCYGAGGDDGAADEEPVQYADLAAWLNELFEADEGATGAAYWRKLDLTAARRLQPPFQRAAMSPDAPDEFRPRAVTVPLDAATGDKAAACARAYGVAPSTVLLACWQLLIARLTGQAEIAVGVRYDGRNYEELTAALGSFAKYLPVPLRTDAGLTFGDALRQVDEAARTADERQEGFDWGLAAGDDSDAEPPFFPCCFEFAARAPEVKAAGVTFAVEESDACADRFKLKLSVEDFEGRAAATLHYDAAWFDSEAAERLAAQLARVVQSAVAAPDAAVERLDLLPPSERERVLVDFNRTRTEYPADKFCHELFEAQAARTPDAVAVVYKDTRLTYGELNARANQIAHRLRRLGVGPDALVAVLAERSVELLAGLLGVLKAGGAYVPLDLQYPQARLAYMLASAAPAVLLTQEKFKDLLPGAAATRVLSLDGERESLLAESDENPRARVGGDNLAYVLYTSGSTGQPKGVMIPHRGLANYLDWCLRTYVAPGGAGAPAHSPVGFDLTVTSLFAPLVAGQPVVLLEEGAGGAGLAAVLRGASEQFSFVKLTPAHLDLLGHELTAEELAGRAGALVIGGEALSYKSLAAWRRHAPATRLINEYGPTETVVGCSIYEVSDSDPGSGVVPIGRPVQNTRLYLLDDLRRPVPVGVAGHLYIAGDGLARGYLNRPALTAERFEPDPFSAEPGARMYRSGDVARHRPDDQLEFLGRSDQQVKIRGYRIELGEIEATLLAHPSVREAAVRTLEDASGERRLAAYFVARPGAAVTPQELRAHCAERLPEYMTPAAFVALDALPLTPNGKVDARALPTPDYAAQGAAAPHAHTRTPAEELLAAIWRELLGLERVGPDDDFFRLGGHSLLATRVVTKVRDVFGVELMLQDLFEVPTLGALAALIMARQRAGGEAAQPDLQPVAREGRLPLSFAQQRLWLIDQLEPGSPVYNVPVAVRLAGRLDVAALTQTLNEIVRRHEVLRTTFVAEDGVPAQVIAPELTCALTLHDLSAQAAGQREAEAERLIAEEARRPFDLAAGPLFRAGLLRLADAEHVLLLTMHHIVSDGWSLGVLIHEMAALYEAFAAGRAPLLPELPAQYADYAVRQREWLQGPTLGALLGYWKRQLAGAPQTLLLPTDRPRQSAFSAHGARQTFHLGAELSGALNDLCRQERVTLFMLLLAAFSTLLQKRSGADDVVVGTDVAGRNSSAAERLIGFFINQLVLRVNLAGDPSFRELLGRVRETTLGAYAHQDVPFDKLVEELQPERAAGSTPLFQVKLVLQNFPMPTLEIPGLTLAPVDAGAGVEAAKFDLLMTLVETDDGLGGSLEYRTALFEPETVGRLVQGFEALLRDAASRPDAHLSELEGRGAEERAAQAQAKQKSAASALQKLMAAKPKAVTVSSQDLVKTETLQGEAALPLVVRPNQLRVDLSHWVETNRDLIEARLLRHGGILFRSFGVASQPEFERFLRALGLPLMRYTEGATPRTELGDKVYTSTEYPADQSIALHNELTYVTTWPMRIIFCCVEPATERGETPIADVRRVWQRLDPAVRRRFEDKGGWLLVRNFGEGLSLPWQRSFHTDDPREVEAYCRSARIEFEWGAGDRLRTRQTRPASAAHPRTGERVWFNHVAFWHESSLAPGVRAAMREMFGAEGLPYNTYYGDGSPIEDEVVAEIRAAYDAETVVFPWERGDVLLLDNMMVAHGRSPYAGPRRILTAMGEAHTRDDF